MHTFLKALVSVRESFRGGEKTVAMLGPQIAALERVETKAIRSSKVHLGAGGGLKGAGSHSSG